MLIPLRYCMLKETIQSILPWILFFILTGHTQQQMDVAISVATVTSIIFEFKGLQKRFF